MRTAATTGTNVAALGEAIGQLLDERRIVLSDEVIELARIVQAERGGRTPDATKGPPLHPKAKRGPL